MAEHRKLHCHEAGYIKMRLSCTLLLRPKKKVLVSGNPTDPPETDPTVTFFSPCLLSQKYGNVQFTVPTTDSGEYRLLAPFPLVL